MRSVPASETLQVAEIHQRAATGAVLIGAKGVVIQILALAGNIVLARLLVPNDFGVFAFASTIVLVLANLAGPGMGSALVRAASAPDRMDLETLLAIQLGVTLTAAPVGAAIAWQFGELGHVTSVMLLTLPVLALRGAGVVVLERELRWGLLVTTEVVESAVFYVASVAAVVLGAGVWGLAIGAVARALSGTGLLLAIAPVGIVRPRFSRDRARKLLSMGMRVQAVDLVGLLRDHGLNIGIAAISGVSTLGLYALAQRLLQAPILLMTALWRVSFPAMSRLAAAGEDPRPVVERSVRVVAAGLGLALVPLAASAPALVPSVFGGRWADAADVVPLACLGFMISVPISIGMTGYLWAAGDARTPLRVATVHTVVLGAVALPLLPPLGLTGVGVGIAVSSLVDAVLLSRAGASKLGTRLLETISLPTVIAVSAAAAGWGLATWLEPTLVSAAASALAAAALYLAGLRVTRRKLFEELVRTARGAYVASRAKPA
jgi:PST family polysaccharide transporter